MTVVRSVNGGAGSVGSAGGGVGAGSITNTEVAAGAAISADKLADGASLKVMTAAERTKLASVAAGATANSADATLLARANHTGAQSADTLVDGTANHVFTAADDAKLAGITAGAAAPAVANIPAGSTLTVLKAGSSWPARPTSRSDVVVIWKGADPSPAIVSSGTGGMLDNVDIRFVS